MSARHCRGDFCTWSKVCNILDRCCHQTAPPQHATPCGKERPTHVAILRSHDRTEWSAVIVPPGESIELPRRWLWQFLGSKWHLMEIRPIWEDTI